ncbi:MAG: transcriptional regulator [Sphingobacteriales bacterium 17-39-43]|uniref:GntR family transcriptional regulator n=1 Tax=Daejeonella sp. TaxID=2805397 RepID=UPI000BD59179|nr:GntR family transcriptional regulator [Daejeonella sp.]OYZ32200.1 MAG: transcriptional regulator [Sphingobacteriales bacterium 16-39-50]OZA25544.1 MAG: transcriptional regulator [Sphingobacteriales bacterium 17-39-43]HQS51116.1 GntR family transcriptional regulator [Daejeonella sp.]HQT22182.1 GntR family transcriptional regulator [Daejeonella sp.]HQT57489.1 GntR family transcriptional regulator [Daejeonella sp.]
MKRTRLFNHIHIDGYSATPKYLQLTNSIKDAIIAGKIKKDDLLPSINELSCILEISRDTAEKGYKHLKSLGIVNSVPGKGYYISNVDFRQRLRIFLLFNKLSSHKKIVYDAFVAALGEHVAIDFYIYNNDFALFKKLLDNKKEDYSHYVIIPHFIEGGEESYRLINEIPKDKLILLDKLLPGVEGEYAAVYENFEKDIYNALEQARDQLSKYHTLKIIFPDKSYFPNEIIKGFNRFCQQYAFSHKIVNDISTEPIQEGEVFINLMEADLVTLIERIISLKLKVGKQVGVISYNETPLKKVILNGITTISTDFSKMGELAAQLILSNSHAHAEVPFHLTLRPSL